VLGCFAAFIVTQRLKHTPAALQEPRRAPIFSPTSTGRLKDEPISFKLAEADEVTVTIVNQAGNGVATLTRDRPVPRYKTLSLLWNGREGPVHGYRVLSSPHGYKILLALNRGRIAPAGEYRVRVSLRTQDRTLFMPLGFTLAR
jgi:hypothetical protein